MALLINIKNEEELETFVLNEKVHGCFYVNLESAWNNQYCNRKIQILIYEKFLNFYIPLRKEIMADEAFFVNSMTFLKEMDEFLLKMETELGNSEKQLARLLN